MKNIAVLISALGVLFSAQAIAEQAPAEAVFGQSLMSPVEIADFQTKLSSSVSAEDRKRIETEHQQRMIQRARWKGLVLPQPEHLTLATSD